MKITLILILTMLFIQINGGTIKKSVCPLEGTYCVSEEQALANCASDAECSHDLNSYEEVECTELMYSNLISECEQYDCMERMKLQSKIFKDFIHCGKIQCDCDLKATTLIVSLKLVLLIIMFYEF